MSSKPVQKKRSKIVDELLKKKENLLLNENFKKIIEEANESKITCDQFSSILRKVHEEFIFHINNNLEPQLNNLDQINLNNEPSTSNPSNLDTNTIIHQLQFKIEALENEKALFDNLTEVNKKTLDELESIKSEFDNYKSNCNRQLSLRDDFISYLKRIVINLYTELNVSIIPEQQAEPNQSLEKDLIQLKFIDKLLLNLILELRRRKSNMQSMNKNLNNK